MLKHSFQDINFKTVIPCVTYTISVWGNCSPRLVQSMNASMLGRDAV